MELRSDARVFRFALLALLRLLQHAAKPPMAAFNLIMDGSVFDWPYALSVSHACVVGAQFRTGLACASRPASPNEMHALNELQAHHAVTAWTSEMAQALCL